MQNSESRFLRMTPFLSIGNEKEHQCAGWTYAVSWSHVQKCIISIIKQGDAAQSGILQNRYSQRLWIAEHYLRLAVWENWSILWRRSGERQTESGTVVSRDTTVDDKWNDMMRPFKYVLLTSFWAIRRGKIQVASEVSRSMQKDRSRWEARFQHRMSVPIIFGKAWEEAFLNILETQRYVVIWTKNSV